MGSLRGAGAKRQTKLVKLTAFLPENDVAAVSGGRMSHAWRALRHRNFKLFFLGQSVSMIGTWMTRLATTRLVYHLIHSALLLGIVNFARKDRRQQFEDNLRHPVNPKETRASYNT